MRLPFVFLTGRRILGKMIFALSVKPSKRSLKCLLSFGKFWRKILMLTCTRGTQLNAVTDEKCFKNSQL